MKTKTFVSAVALISLTSCTPNSSSSISIKTPSVINTSVNHDYIEIKDYRTSWYEFFDIDLDEYFVYFFSRTCSHCESFKNTIIEIALSRRNIYFVEDSDEVKFTDDISKTIGLTSIEDFVILGFPTLVEISNHKITKNVAGTKNINSLLFS